MSTARRSTLPLAGLALLLGAVLLAAAPASACPSGKIPVCTAPTPCPKDGQIYSYCLAGKAVNGCQISSRGPFPPADCSSQCLVPANAPVCTDPTPCPRDGQSYYYCLSGKAVNGCQIVSRGLFPAVDCSVQCQAPAVPPA